MNDFLKVGIIANTHGLRGEVKVFPTTDDPQRYRLLDYVFLDTGKEKQKMEIASVRFFKHMVILKFKGMDDIRDAEPYLKKDLYVTRDQAVPLGENEYFIADLIGLRAISDEGEELGELADVINGAANDVYVIRKKDTPDLLVPAIRHCVLRIDLAEGVIVLHLLKGLREATAKA